MEVRTGSDALVQIIIEQGHGEALRKLADQPAPGFKIAPDPYGVRYQLKYLPSS